MKLKDMSAAPLSGGRQRRASYLDRWRETEGEKNRKARVLAPPVFTPVTPALALTFDEDDGHAILSVETSTDKNDENPHPPPLTGKRK